METTVSWCSFMNYVLSLVMFTFVSYTSFYQLNSYGFRAWDFVTDGHVVREVGGSNPGN